MFRVSTWGRVLFPGLTWRTRGDSVHLTFDDGPHPEITPWVLDELDRYDVKATFFLVGQYAEKYPHLIDDIRNQGHQIGNHTYSHVSGWRTTFYAYMADVERAQEFLGSTLFRPPYGKMTIPQMRELKKRYEIMMWDVMPRDFDQRVSPERVLSRIKLARPGSIVVLHENKKAWRNLRVVLPEVLRSYVAVQYLEAGGPVAGHS